MNSKKEDKKDGKDLTTKEAFEEHKRWFRPRNKDGIYPGSELYKQHMETKKWVETMQA